MTTATAIILPNKYKTGASALKGNRIIDSLGIAKEKQRGKLELQAKHALLSQSEEAGVDIEIREVGVDSIPVKVSTDLVIILDEKNFLPPKYLERVKSATTLFSSAVLCGPITNHIQKVADWFKEDISSFYRSYSVDMYKASSLTITDDLNLYPNLYNTVFTGEVYNEIGGYSPLKGSKIGNIFNNRLMISEAAEIGEIVYLKDLGVSYIFNEEELSHNAILKHFYELGFLDGAIQPQDKIEDVVWQKYVNNSERFDYSMPMWVAVKDGISGEDKKKEYAHKLAAFRTIYNLGFFEGLEGISLI